MRLVKKTALITGGSKGIGKAIAQRFLEEGAKVIIFDVEKPDYEVEFYKVDISKEEEIESALQQIEKLDILVNNAGIYFQASVEKTAKKQLDQVIDVNLKGTFLMCKHGLPLIKKSKGNIINISSGLGIVPEPESPAYCSTKAAIIMLTKCMAQKYASESVSGLDQKRRSCRFPIKVFPPIIKGLPLGTNNPSTFSKAPSSRSSWYIFITLPVSL